MNKFVFLFTILSLGICSVKGNSLDVATGRETVNLNREWMYKIGDYENAKQPLYDDTSWEPVGLPHSFSIPYFCLKTFMWDMVGIGSILRWIEPIWIRDCSWSSTVYFRRQKYMSMDIWSEAMWEDIPVSVLILHRTQWKEIT